MPNDAWSAHAGAERPEGISDETMVDVIVLMPDERQVQMTVKAADVKWSTVMKYRDAGSE